MGVYIEGMKMPTDCRTCQMKMNCTDCEGWECYCLPLGKEIGDIGQLLNDRRRDDCPLVPVPPHGRLIYADEFLKRAIGTKCFRGDYALMLEELVGESTTIIPAEGGET